MGRLPQINMENKGLEPQKKSELTSIHLKVTKEFLSDLDNYTKEFNFTNRTEAMRFLLSVGLKYQKNLLKDVD